MANINYGIPNVIPFTYTTYKDQHLLENTGNTPLTYTIEKVSCDVTQITLVDILVDAGEKVELPINKVDGNYSVIIKQGANTGKISDLIQYNNLLLIFLEGAESLLCGCARFSECADCDSHEYFSKDKALSTITAALSYNNLEAPKYDSYYETLAQNLNCEIGEEANKFVTSQYFLGQESIQKLLLQNVALYYMSFYYIDVIGAKDEEEVTFVKEKYKSVVILNCIKKLGISIKEAKEDLTDSARVYYWQANDPSKTSTQMLNEANVPGYIVSQSSDLFDVFEAGKLIEYADVGRIAFCVDNPTGPNNYYLYDVIGNNVTSGFIRTILSPTQVLYVSINPYSVGPMLIRLILNT
jgi:hypothetical protein